MDSRHADFIAQQLQSGQAGTALTSSWRRSMFKYGLDPAGQAQPGRLTFAELAQRRQAAELLLQVAAPQLQSLFALVGLSGCSVMMSDADGVVLEQLVADGDAAQFRDWGLWAGTQWSEAAQGTNGIGTCLAEGRALTIHRDEHFHSRNTGMSCMDAPIWGPDGRLLAALDVSSARADQTEPYARLIAAQVAQTARSIESRLFRASFPGARIVVADAGQPEAAMLLAVDQDDLAIGATRAARRALGLEREGALRPRPAVDLLQGETGGFDKAERAAIKRALARVDGNMSAAARALGIGRATLYRRMGRLGLDKPAELSRK